MGANEWSTVVLSRLNSLKQATLEELYMAIFLRLLPDSYREHFAHCKLAMAEELAAKADGLWEMKGGNAATVAAVSRPASPRRQSQGRWQKDGGGSGGGGRQNNNRGRGGSRGHGNGGRGGGQCRDWSPTPWGALQQDGGYATANGSNLLMGPSRGPGCAFTTTATATRRPDASRHAYSTREKGRPPAAIEPIAVGGDGGRRRLPLP
jgi:hypothetical protein